MSYEDEMIRVFRGLPRGYSKDPAIRAKPINGLLDVLTKRFNIEGPRLEVLIIQNWRAIVGANKAHRCKPSKIVNKNKLVITTTNTTLRMELQFEREKILENLHRVCGDKTIQDIVVR